jgi:hypothetical protein
MCDVWVLLWYVGWDVLEVVQRQGEKAEEVVVRLSVTVAVAPVVMMLAYPRDTFSQSPLLLLMICAA